MARMTRRIRVTRNAGALTALAVALVMMLANLGGPALVQPDEGRNAEVAREMAASGEWLVPSFNGLTYLDKPAFYFDLVAVSLKALGNTETAARLPSALFGLLLTGMVWLFCRREYGEPAASLAAMVVASSPMVFVFARSVIFDIVLTFFVCAAILCGYLGSESEGRRRSAWFALGAAAAGTATLVKGPVGAIVPAIVLAAFLWIDGKRRAILRIVHPLNLAVFLALVLPWFLALVRRYPDFLEYGLLRESLDRLTKPVFERGGPWYYYLPVLAGALFPWSLLLPEAVAAWWRSRGRLARADRFFAVWAAAVFIFFSLSRTKHPGYVLPGVVALGALLGRGFSLALSDPRGRAAALVRRGAVALAAVALAACALLAVEAGRPGGLAGLAGVEPARARWVAGAVPLLIGALLVVAGLATCRTLAARSPARLRGVPAPSRRARDRPGGRARRLHRGALAPGPGAAPGAGRARGGARIAGVLSLGRAVLPAADPDPDHRRRERAAGAITPSIPSRARRAGPRPWSASRSGTRGSPRAGPRSTSWWTAAAAASLPPWPRRAAPPSRSSRPAGGAPCCAPRRGTEVCGICGLVGIDRPLPGAQTGPKVRTMLSLLAHRGPDETRVASGADGTLGATRLAIRGVHSGSQPLADPDTGILAVCNGEIDNHRELRAWLEARGRAIRLDTDIAVIPALYLECGERFVERLVGAFALALWDPRERALLLARDRAGERPLFYSRTGGTVRFASEVAALVSDPDQPLTPDLPAIGHYLRFGCFAAPMTAFAEVRRVRPGERITIGPGGTKHERYWRFPVAGATGEVPSLERFDAVFRSAVRSQSDVEVPCGVFLSGGIDSSLVAAVARRERGEPLRAYTVRFREHSYDEGDAASQVARLLGCDSADVWVGAGDFPEGIARLIGQSGEPLADPAWVPASLLARRAAEDVKVVLVGEGADELFGGYPTYIGALLCERYARLPRLLRAAFARLVRAWPVSDRKVTVSYLLKKFVDGADLDGMERHRAWTSSIPPALLARLWAGAGDALAPAAPGSGPSTGSRPGEGAAARLLDLVQLHDLETSLAEGLLTKADRAGMGSGLELRAPFLDRDVMEFAATLPASSRVRGLKTKIFLKAYALGYLPSSIVNRRKRGLSVPLAAWLRGPLKDWARGRLASPRLASIGIRTDAALEVLHEHCGARADHARALWTLIVLEEWLEWLAGRRGTQRS